MYSDIPTTSSLTYAEAITKVIDNKNITVDSVVGYDAYYQNYLSTTPNWCAKTETKDATKFKNALLNGKSLKASDIVIKNQTNKFNVAKNDAVTVEIIPSPYKYTKYNGSYVDINNSSMMVVIKDNAANNTVSVKKGNFKYIFPGDIQTEAIEFVNNHSGWLTSFSKTDGGVEYENVYYKASHHGKRKYSAKKFYNQEKALLTKVKPNVVIGTGFHERSDNTLLTTFLKCYELEGKYNNLNCVHYNTYEKFYNYISYVSKTLHNYGYFQYTIDDDGNKHDDSFRETYKNFLWYKYYETMLNDLVDNHGLGYIYTWTLFE